MKRLIHTVTHAVFSVLLFGFGDGNAQQLPTFSAKVVGSSIPHASPSFTYWGVPVDLDGDGRDELVQTYANFPPGPNRSEPVKVLKADPRTFAYNLTSTIVTGTVPSFVHPRVFARGDFNKDGRVDLFLGGHGYDASPFTGEKDKLLISSSGGRQTGSTAPPKVDTFTHAAAVGDINRDGIDDVFVGTLCCGQQGPYFLLGQNGATPLVATNRLPTSVVNRTVKYTAAALVDVDKANGPDLALGNDGGGGDNVVFLNNGQGNFSKASADIVLPAGLFGRGTTITVDMLSIDMDTDGWPDLLCSQTNAKPFYQGYGLQVLKNNQGKSFSDQTASRLLQSSGFSANGAWVTRIFAADFFGDGIVDFVTSDAYPTTSSTFVIWLNDGAGIFTPYPRPLFDVNDPNTDANLLYPIDVNKDGRSDIVRIKAVDQTNDQAWTYINNGLTSGTAAKPQVVRQPVGVTVKRGSPIRLSLAAKGQRPLKFQWLKNNNPIGNATSPVYEIPSASNANSGTYSVKVLNSAGTVISSAVTVKVN